MCFGRGERQLKIAAAAALRALFQRAFDDFRSLISAFAVQACSAPVTRAGTRLSTPSGPTGRSSIVSLSSGCYCCCFCDRLPLDSPRPSPIYNHLLIIDNATPAGLRRTRSGGTRRHFTLRAGALAEVVGTGRSVHHSAVAPDAAACAECDDAAHR